MKEFGTVVRIEENDCIIEIQPQSGCGHCSMNTCCSGTDSGKRELTLKRGNMKMNPGDVVEIETPARGFYTAAFLIFIFPLFLSMTAYMIVEAQTDSSKLAIAGFFGCFVISEILIGWIDRLFGRKKVFEPHIVRRLKREPEDS